MRIGRDYSSKVDINSWLERFKTRATKNRYKAFPSLCYREGIKNEKVSVNPAKVVRRKKEPTGRASPQ